MATTTRTHRIVARLSVIGAVLILGSTAQAGISKPPEMSNAEYQALMLRSEALNKKYHLGAYSRAAQGTTSAQKALLLRGQALNKKYHLGTYSQSPQGMTAPAYRALLLRGEALNEAYHLGAFAPATPTVSANEDFSWSAFGIGAAAMLGFVLLAIGAVVGGRGWRTPPTRVSS